MQWREATMQSKYPQNGCLIQHTPTGKTMKRIERRTKNILKRDRLDNVQWSLTIVVKCVYPILEISLEHARTSCNYFCETILVNFSRPWLIGDSQTEFSSSWYSCAI